MIADSIKFRGHRCFKNEFVGFDEIKLINVIIGRNNTGKSHLLDLIDGICQNGLKRSKRWTCRFTAQMKEETLKPFFSGHENKYFVGRRRVDFGGSSDVWENNGILFVDKIVSWDIDGQGREPSNIQFFNSWESARKSESSESLDIISTTSRPEVTAQILREFLRAELRPLRTRFFRRLYADRNFLAEPANVELYLGPDGAGARPCLKTLNGHGEASR